MFRSLNDRTPKAISPTWKVKGPLPHCLRLENKLNRIGKLRVRFLDNVAFPSFFSHRSEY